jgi:hypothetical protein
MSGTGPAFAQDTRYRVEVLVLTLLEQNEEPRERTELPDYSSATDFLTPPANEAESQGDPATELASTNDAAETADELAEPAEAVAPAEDPNRLVHVAEMSNTMQEAWRRLRLSGPYRPEQYLSWEQGNQEPFPTLRLHDLETVRVDDPWRAFRTQPGGPTTFTDAGDPAAVDGALEIEGPQLPEPVTYYRLDGVVSLRRSRFLHLDLDLQLREPVWGEETPLAPRGENRDDGPVPPSSFLVHELKQSRQVRSGRMEYFDGPVLGVLAWISVIEGESEEAP